MLLRTALVAALSFFSLPLAAQCVGDSYLDQLSAKDQTALADAAANIPYGQGILWQATKDDHHITVVGTMHIYDPRLEKLRAAVHDAVTTADLILLEATKEDQDNLQNLLVSDPNLLFITDGPTLPDLLDDDTWNLISDAASARSIPSFMAAKMQPWYLSMMLAIPPCAMQDMTNGNLGLDHMIIEDAASAGVPTQALESMMTLFDIFKADPLDEQIDMLRINLQTPATQQKMFVAMLDRYFAGDVASLWEMSRLAMTQTSDIGPAKAAELFAETEQALLIDRNRSWTPLIAEAARTHDALVIAVGAAHLIGEDGILAFLDNDGWALTALR